MKYFKKAEFDCKCGCGENLMRPEFMSMIDEARELAGVPFKVTSGYRCYEYNLTVSRVEKSAHTLGYAADIAYTNSADAWRIVNACMYVGFNRIGIARNFIHVDCDPSKDADVIWTY